MPSSAEAELLKRRRAGFDLAINDGYFFRDGGKVKMTERFRECFEKNWRVDSPMLSEELVYRSMLIVRELSPDLGESDFLRIRRAIWMFSYGEHEGWWKNHQRPERPVAYLLKKLGEVREAWGKVMKPEEKRDILTSVADNQLENVIRVIGMGKNFVPELHMWQERNVFVSLIFPPDPMTQAIAAVKQSKPDGYSFAAEAWRAPLTKDYHKWGDLEKSESKIEAFVQVCAENDGPRFIRTFTIDRVKAALVRDGDEGSTRMPALWELANERPTSTPGSGPYT